MFATSLEAEYPRKFCICLVQCVMRQLQRQNMGILPDALFDVKDNKLFEMQTARIAAEQQPRKNKLPPLIPDSFAIGVFYVHNASEVPCALQSKLKKTFHDFTRLVNLLRSPSTPGFCAVRLAHHLLLQKGVRGSVMA